MAKNAERGIQPLPVIADNCSACTNKRPVDNADDLLSEIINRGAIGGFTWNPGQRL